MLKTIKMIHSNFFNFLTKAVPAFLLAWLAGGVLSGGGAQAMQAAPPVLMEPEIQQVAPADLEVFVGALMEAHLAEYDIPGAAVAVVQDGQVLLAEGYGYANLENQLPVRADETIFDLASVAKVFTWTAVMQLVEQGKLDLDADINQYLETLPFPAVNGRPITLRHLMTHQAGFEYDYANATPYAAEVASPETLFEHLKNNRPAQIYTPGEVTAYSNYGTALAGHIVAQVSGMRFEDYAEAYLFAPLEMGHSTFRQPLPTELAADLVRGYLHIQDGYRFEPYDYFRTIPASALHATAADMAHFMLAHLQGGRYGEAQILAPGTIQQMQTTLHQDIPTGGNAHGWWENTFNGQRVLYHAGDNSMAHSLVLLVPEQRLGLFVTYNSDGGTSARTALTHAFFDRFFPALPADGNVLPENPVALDRFAGYYLRSRHPETTWQKIQVLFTTYQVAPAGEEALAISSPLGLPEEYQLAGTLVFERHNNKEQVFFKEDSGGQITEMIFTREPSGIYFRLPWHQTPPFHLGLLIFFLIGLLILWGSSMFGLLMERRRKHLGAVNHKLTQTIRRLIFAAASLDLLFLAGLGAGIFTLLADTRQLSYAGMPAVLGAALALPLLAILPTAGCAWALVVMLRQRKGSLWNRIYALTGVLILAGYLWFLHTWNFIGWQV